MFLHPGNREATAFHGFYSCAAEFPNSYRGNGSSAQRRAPRFGAILIAMLVLAFAPSLLAQTAGTIAGTVTDVTGAVIPNATVTLTNTETAAVRNVTTNGVGRYVFPAVPPGTYDLRATANGFQAAVHSGIVLSVQQALAVNFKMSPGSVTQTVTVKANAAQLNTLNTTVGTVIQNEKIETLPLNGRDFLQLIRLSSNVTTDFASPGQATARQGTTRADENFSVMGSRSAANYYTLDGINNTDPNFNLITMQPSVDAIQEFKVQTGVYPAEYGVEANQINVLTKSGTNQFHGSVFDYLRNDVLDAQQYNFTGGAAPAKNPFKQNQFGYVLSGPVLIPKVFNGRNKLFFMSNYQGFRVRQSSNSLYTVPTQAMRDGNFSYLLAQGNVLYNPATKSCTSAGVCTGTPFSYNGQQDVIPPTDINPASTILMQPAYLPLPNLGQTDVLHHNNYFQVNPNPTNTDQVTERVDFTQNSKSSWFGRYSWTSQDTSSRGLGEAGNKIVTNGDQAVLGWTYVISPSKVNQAHIGWTMFHNGVETALAGVTNVVGSLNIPGFSTPDPASWGIPQITGFTDGLSGWGDGTSSPFVLKDENFEENDNFSWIIGNHTLNFGFDVQRGHYDYKGNEFSRARFSFDGAETANPTTQAGGESFADFLTGYCSVCADALSPALTIFRRTAQFYYADDTWQVTPKLTLSYGLRYAFVPPWNDLSQNILNTIVPQVFQVLAMNQANITTPSLQPTIYRPGTGDFYAGHENVRFAAPIQTSRQNLYGGRLIQTNYLDFAPRFGISFHFLPNWVVRTGFGLFYSQDSSIEFFDMARGWGRIAATNDPQNPTYTYQNFINSNGGVTTISHPNVYGYIPHTPWPYVESYIMQFQHTIGSNTELDFGYSGSVGRHLEGIMNINPAIPGTTGTPSSRAPFTYLGIIQVLEGEDVSSYNAFSAKISHTMSNGITYLASYTWSKSLDNSSGIRGVAGTILPQNDRCLICDYGYSAFNIPNRFVGSVIYQLPFGKGGMFLRKGGYLNQIVGGWEVSSIVTLQSGLPVNTGTGFVFNPSGVAGYGEWRLQETGVSPNQSSRTLGQWYNPQAFALPAPGTFGNWMRNGLLGPSIFEWDFSTLKNFPITETQQLQFRMEIFNAPNHPNWGAPAMSWNSRSYTTPNPGFDTISSTLKEPNSMREIQVALKYIF